MISICDFEDSFTYNIFSDLCDQAETNVIPFSDVYAFLKNATHSTKRQVIILGPGPGHPKDHLYLNPILKQLYKNKNILIIGICLGHQLIWQSFGLEITRSYNPVHGQIEVLNNQSAFFGKNDQPSKLYVQRYNSLCVPFKKQSQIKFSNEGGKFLVKGSELYASKVNNILSYQFHPESVGTFNKSLYYKAIELFLHH